MNMRLVPMDRSHLPAVAEIERQCFSRPWTEEMIAQELYNDLSSLVVAEGEYGAVLGYGLVKAVLDEGCLEKIAVAPDARRQGVAAAILGAFLRYGRAHLAFLTLEVREKNAPAIALYQKFGLQVVGRRKNYYADLKEDAILMTVEFDGHDRA